MLGRRKRSLLAGGRSAREGGTPDDASDEIDGPDDTGEALSEPAASEPPSPEPPASEPPASEPVASEPPASEPAAPVDVFAKNVSLAEEAGPRPDLAAPKPSEDEDDWYLRTGQPAPPRDEEGDEPVAPRSSDLRHYGPALALVGGIALLFLLILLFGVLLS